MPNIAWVSQHCESLPHVTQQVQWGTDVVFKVGGKMFAVVASEPGRVWLSFKATPEEFAELVERPRVIPAPYMARAHWVALEHEDAMSRHELRQRLTHAHELVLASLPKKVRAALASG